MCISLTSITNQAARNPVVGLGAGEGVSSVSHVTPGTHTLTGAVSPSRFYFGTGYTPWMGPCPEFFGAPHHNPKSPTLFVVPLYGSEGPTHGAPRARAMGSRIRDSQSLGWHASGGCRWRIAPSTMEHPTEGSDHPTEPGRPFPLPWWRI